MFETTLLFKTMMIRTSWYCLWSVLFLHQSKMGYENNTFLGYYYRGAMKNTATDLLLQKSAYKISS